MGVAVLRSFSRVRRLSLVKLYKTYYLKIDEYIDSAYIEKASKPLYTLYITPSSSSAIDLYEHRRQPLNFNSTIFKIAVNII